MSGGAEDRIRARLQKLLALARRGEGGEAANAQSALDKLLAKHGITLADLDDEAAPMETRWFTTKTEYEKALLTNCIATVVGGERAMKSWVMKRKKGLVGYDLTAGEHAQAALVFDIHLAAFRQFMEQQQKTATIAYIQKNRLFPSDAEDRPRGKSDLSLEDIEAIVAMMGRMRPTTVHKAIAGPFQGRMVKR